MSDDIVDQRIIIIPTKDLAHFKILSSDEINELIKNGYDATFNYYNKNVI